VHFSSPALSRHEHGSTAGRVFLKSVVVARRTSWCMTQRHSPWTAVCFGAADGCLLGGTQRRCLFGGAEGRCMYLGPTSDVRRAPGARLMEVATPRAASSPQQHQIAPRIRHGLYIDEQTGPPAAAASRARRRHKSDRRCARRAPSHGD
jgi:hypothetical protein